MIKFDVLECLSVSWQLTSLDTFVCSIFGNNAPNIAFVISITTDEGVERSLRHLGDTVNVILMHQVQLALGIILNGFWC